METDDTKNLGRAARLATPVVAALLVGGGVGFALHHSSPSAAASGSTPPAFGGGVAGEQHVRGTVVAKTSSSVTVKSSNGTTTYAISVTSDIVRNGRAATMSEIKVGDPVVVHVYPSSSGKTLVERLLAGTSAVENRPGGGFGPPPAPVA